jgi:hypothetical protein
VFYLLRSGLLIVMAFVLAAPCASLYPAAFADDGASQPVKLFGRIEQLASGPGAKLPQLKALTPKLDTGSTLKGSASEQSSRPLSGKIASSFPVNWRGTWSGKLKIWSAQFDRIRWQFDPAEANKERELMTPGTEGSVSFTFSNDPSGRIALRPTQVIFSRPMEGSRYADVFQGMNTSQLGASGEMLAQAFRNIPYMYALHLGDLHQGVGVTGNLREAQVLKNEIRELKPGVLEQDIVNYNVDVNRESGKTQKGYSESVLRFYRQGTDRLYVQAATVGYTEKGRFMDKIVLYGTVSRGASQSQIPGYSGSFPGGFLFPGFPQPR